MVLSKVAASLAAMVMGFQSSSQLTPILGSGKQYSKLSNHQSQLLTARKCSEAMSGITFEGLFADLTTFLGALRKS